ncbi:MAG: sulfatase [Paenibacillaceae bacterium]|jgi:phosphoglycerol transferase MdoB-like AlkP superfamily enzyme|nr:sulfatase [Paenibacillaceae bacterium]
MNRQSLPLTGNRLAKSLFIGTALLLSSCLLSIGVEWISRGSLIETLGWIRRNTAIYALNALIGGSALIFFYSLIGSIFLAIGAAAVVLSVMAFINYYKSMLVGEPFFPWDIILNKEGMDVGPLFTGVQDLLKLAVILVGLGSLIFLHRKLKSRLMVSWISRGILGATSLAVLLSFGLQVSWAKERVAKAGVDETIWSQQANYDSNGLLLAFTLNVQNVQISEPEGYSAEKMETLAKELTASAPDEAVPAFGQTDSSGAAAPKKRPNVIFIMSEAFWDPTLLSNVSFSADPVPTLHQLQQSFPSGTMLSPQFGGGTSNVEFEVLTGLSMSFMPAGSVPYLQYVNGSVPSLASYFESKGYRSLGIHTYDGWFWNREDVYRLLGFEGFKSKDGFIDPEYNGLYISDKEIAGSIIHEVNRSEDPVFIYAVTMQNHAPYTDKNRYPSGNTFKVEGDLTEEARDMLETYAQGAHYADQALQELVDYFAAFDEPTYIVFYGDHLPTLGLEYDLYRQAGFVQSGKPAEWSQEEYKSLRSVPYVTWSNFAAAEEQRVNTISSSFMGAYVLDTLGMEPEGQFALGSKLYRTVPGLIRNLTVDPAGTLSQTVPAGSEELVEQYRMLQYDILVGDRHLTRYVDAPFLTKEPMANYNTLAAVKEEE